MTERARELRERGEPDPAPPPGPAKPARPPRPIGVELAAAIMIITGAMSTLISIEAAASFASEGTLDEPLAALSIALGIAFVVLGVLVRTGRAWLVALNVAAVAGFLELLSGSAQGVLFGALDVLVVVLLLRDRPWFHGPDAEAEGDGA